MKRLHAIVTGRVQGVGYRDFVRTHALRLGLTGWVRNNADESVEVVVEGENTALAHLTVLLQKGPSLALVDDVEAIDELPTGEFVDFTVR